MPREEAFSIATLRGTQQRQKLPRLGHSYAITPPAPGLTLS